MPKNNAGRMDSPHQAAFLGDRGYMRIGDFPDTNAPIVDALAAVAVATTSAAVNPYGRGLQVLVTFSTAATSCDIKVYRVDDGPVDTLVATFTGVNHTNATHLFVTGAEGVNLDGRAVKVRAENLAGGGTVTAKVRRTA